MVNADPGWGSPVATLFDDVYVVTYDDNIEGDVTLGQFNLFTRLWEGDKVDGKRQFGCALGCLQIPGDELNNNPAITNPQGYNYNTNVEQNFNGDVDVVQYAPRNDYGGGFGGVELEQVTFGADAGGPYGEVSISPTATVVGEILDETQPGPLAKVQTDYAFGSNLTPGGNGGNKRHDLGNSGVLLWDAYEGDPTISVCSIDGEFRAYPGDSAVNEVVDSEELQETYTLLDLS